MRHRRRRGILNSIPSFFFCRSLFFFPFVSRTQTNETLIINNTKNTHAFYKSGRGAGRGIEQDEPPLLQDETDWIINYLYSFVDEAMKISAQMIAIFMLSFVCFFYI
jgi:hypothetical protein